MRTAKPTLESEVRNEELATSYADGMKPHGCLGATATTHGHAAISALAKRMNATASRSALAKAESDWKRSARDQAKAKQSRKVAEASIVAAIDSGVSIRKVAMTLEIDMTQVRRMIASARGLEVRRGQIPRAANLATSPEATLGGEEK